LPLPEEPKYAHAMQDMVLSIRSATETSWNY